MGGNGFFEKLILLFKEKQKVSTPSWQVGTGMQKPVLSEGSSFLLLAVLEDGSYIPEAAEGMIGT